MLEDCFCSDARNALGELCIMLGTHYDLAPSAVDALETLATEDDSILNEATSNWKTIVDVSSDVSGSKTVSSPEVETPNDRQRVGAMRALATLSREYPSTAPIETFVSGIRESHPLVRLYASYGLAAVASRKPEMTHPYVDTIVEEIGRDLNSLGADVWLNPDFSTSAEFIDELLQAKLIRMAFNSTLRIDDSHGFQQVAVDVNERLDGDLVLTADKLVRTLPLDPEIWPNYIDLLNEVADSEPDRYVEHSVS